MAYSFDEFCSECRRTLAADPGPAGRQAIVGHLENLLANGDFIAEQLGPDQTPGRRIVYEDSELGFCIWFHNYDGTGGGPPHDHGASWAVYGQAVDHTEIKEFDRLDDASDADYAELKVAREYPMERGKAALFDVGAIHSINFTAGGRVIRVTGTNLNKIPKLRFDMENKKAHLWEDGQPLNKPRATASSSR